MLTAVNLALAYLLAKRLRLPERQARAVMFDVGAFNSGLGGVLSGSKWQLYRHNAAKSTVWRERFNF
jgi:predicted Na+-dependent transporter